MIRRRPCSNAFSSANVWFWALYLERCHRAKGKNSFQSYGLRSVWGKVRLAIEAKVTFSPVEGSNKALSKRNGIWDPSLVP
ncbi:hypothetical protein HAX54_043168 [Datura stramonium]|uniref:Uncharacterized protein n=1 Tax=Datura stramonium TaxID=4076 RepID=A0ABS8W288_DATST|nr:hypothetical protein [Datura stramonium]